MKYPCYGSPDPSLITVISGLVMHYMPLLIKPESSQRGLGFNLNLNHPIRAKKYLV
jgi:hypothetical protein